jgi:hypothetical protein
MLLWFLKELHEWFRSLGAPVIEERPFLNQNHNKNK